MAKDSKPPEGPVFRLETSGTVYSYPQDWIQLNVFEILTIIREARDEEQQMPPGSWALGALTTFLAFGLCLVATSQFRDVFGFKGDQWGSVVLFFTLLSGAVFVVMFVWWFASQFGRKRRSERQIVQELIDEMQKARAAGKVYLGRK
jgi:hypothetical protein